MSPKMARRCRDRKRFDEFTRERHAIDVSRQLTGEDVQERFNGLFTVRDTQMSLRLDNDPELVAGRLRDGLDRVGVLTLLN